MISDKPANRTTRSINPFIFTSWNKWSMQSRRKKNREEIEKWTRKSSTQSIVKSWGKAVIKRRPENGFLWHSITGTAINQSWASLFCFCHFISPYARSYSSLKKRFRFLKISITYRLLLDWLFDYEYGNYENPLGIDKLLRRFREVYRQQALQALSRCGRRLVIQNKEARTIFSHHLTIYHPGRRSWNKRYKNHR